MSRLQQYARRIHWMRYIPGFRAWNRLLHRQEHASLAREVFGLRFQHPIGLAPVLERQVDLLDECGDLGFSFTGFIPGNTPINTIAKRLQERKSPIVVAVELRAENALEEQAKKDLVRQFSLLYDFADCFILDINRESGLSSLDDFSDWTDLIDELLNLRLCYEKYRPILLRIPTSYTEEQVARVLDFCLLSGLDSIVAPGVAKVRFCADYSKGHLPIVGSGAITMPEEAIELMQAGAVLIEVGQGKGPATAKRLLQAIDSSNQ